MRTKILFTFITLVVALVLAGCASVDAMFLLQKLDDKDKSQVITEKGIEQYNTLIEGRENYRAIGEIREYFVVALRFDPTNRQAQQYMVKLDTFVNTTVREKVDAAKKVLAKAKRTEDENYRLCYYAQKAYELAPDNREVVSLKQSVEKTAQELVNKYVDAARKRKAQMTEKDTADRKEKALLDILDYYNRVLAISPDDSTSRVDKEVTLLELSKLVDPKIAATKKKIETSRFAEAQADLNRLYELNKKLDSRYTQDLRQLTYDLYYRWSAAALDQKNYALAESLADIALQTMKTAEAMSVRSRAVSARSQTDTAAAFTTRLKEIDDHITRREYTTAFRKVRDLQAQVSDADRTEKLRYRESQIRTALPSLYESALVFYKDEQFKKAIDLLVVIVEIDKTYEMAQEYLEKARAKQKLIETY